MGPPPLLSTAALGACRLKVYLGTVTFGWSQSSVPVDATVASDMVRLFAEAGGTSVDTAHIYSGGMTESIVGVACAPYAGALRIGTKVHPSQPGGLGAAGLRAQFDASVSALGSSLGEYCRSRRWATQVWLESTEYRGNE
jgi:aryl-alcohol dehydrogenase-like predicted oxidoreductase